MEGIRKKTAWKVILGLEILALLLAVGAAVFSGKNLKEMHYEGTELPFSIEPEGEAPDCAVDLKRGSYEVTVSYTAKHETLCQTLMQTAYGKDYGDSILLLKEMNEKTYELMLYHDATDLYVCPVYENAAITIEGITIRETNQWNRMLCVILFAVFLAADLLLWLKREDRWKNLPSEKKDVILAVTGIGILASMPLFTNYLMQGADLSFHLMRIEGIAEGLKSGMFPVKMQPLWMNDYGYPVSIMYGDLLLYLPAILRLAGFSLQTVFKFYVFGINLLTAYTSYKCADKITNNYKISVVMSLVYTLSGYRLTSAYVKAAMGEVTAMAFLPVVFLGLWTLFYEEEKPKQRRGAFWLIVGYTGILESHLLSFEMAILFSVLFCVLNWKIFRKRFGVLLVTAGFTILLNLFYLVPMLDYMLTQDLHIHHVNNVNMQSTGLLLPQLFKMFLPKGDGGAFEMLAPVSYGVWDEIMIGPGFPFALLMLLYVWECLSRKKKLEGTYGSGEYRAVQKMLVLVVLACYMTTYLFPWSFLQNVPGIGGFLAPYQFPMRFSVMILSLGIMVGAYALKSLDAVMGNTAKKIVIACICGVAVLHFLSYSEYLFANADPIKVTSAAGVDTRNAVVSGEYLLEGAYFEAVNVNEPQAEEGVVVHNWERKGVGVTVSCENTLEKEGYVKVPVFTYKGYQVVDRETGYGLTVWPAEHNVMMIILPSGYQGEVDVEFVVPGYWHLAELISLAAFLGAATYGIRRHLLHRRRRNG